MTQDDTLTPDRIDTVSQGRPMWQKIAIGIVGFIIAIVALAGLLLLGLNTQPGKKFLIQQIAAFQMESGMAIEVGRIDGSIYSDMVIHDLILRDPKGVFAVSPRVHVVWKPFRYINNHISVSLLETPLVVLARSPQFNETPTDPNAPILPDLDIDVDRMKIGKFILARPVIGQKREIAIDGVTHIADGRAILSDGICEREGPLWRDDGDGTRGEAPTAVAWKGMVGQVLGSGLPVAAQGGSGLPADYTSFVGLPVYRGETLTHIVAWYN